MFVVRRSIYNPPLSPDPANLWESIATSNWCPIRIDDEDFFLYSAVGNTRSIGCAQMNPDGTISKRRQVITPQFDWEKNGCENPRVTFFENAYYIFYNALSTPSGVAVAITRDFQKIDKKLIPFDFNVKSLALFPERIKGKIVLVVTLLAATIPAQTAIAELDNIEQLWDIDFWRAWHADLDQHILDVHRLPTDAVQVGAPPLKTARGWLLIYAHTQQPHRAESIYGIEALLLDLAHPHHIIGRTKGPLLIPEEIYECSGTQSGTIDPSGARITTEKSKHGRWQHKLEIYYGAGGSSGGTASVDLDDLLDSIIPDVAQTQLIRFKGNPILTPFVPDVTLDPRKHQWESKAVFNPATIEINGTIHILYRAMSADNTSSIGYASSRDGFHINERLPYPVYVPRETFETKLIPESNSGCEDPRLVRIGSTLYMTYVAYDSIHEPAIAMTSISVKDFVAQRWNWTKAAIISPTQIDDKDSCLLPERVDGKYMIFHRIGLNICADFLDSLDFNKEKITKCFEIMQPRPGMWDGYKIGISSPPIKTEKGWLLLYHGISERLNYRVGAALLDLADPTKVISRTTDAFLAPEMPYELRGQTQNVVFPCGAVAKNGTLFIYYGAADSVIAVATVKMDTLLKVLL